MTLTEDLDWLIDQWCERRELRPLQFLLRAYAGVLAHTDQFGDLLEALRDVKGLCRDKLRPEELTLVISLMNELEDFINLRLGSRIFVSIGVHSWFEPMLLARVEGNVVATRKHPSLDGWRLVICQPINNAGMADGAPQIAIDAHGAGMHQRVVISSDGSEARKSVGDPKSPVRWLVVGIVDEKEPGVPV